MSNKVTINGNEYSYGEEVESDFFDDKSNWLTRDLDEVLITSINTGYWPIVDNKGITYSVYGIADGTFKVSWRDLISKLKNGNITEEDIKVDVIEDTIEVNDTKEVNDANAAIKDLPILDIQIGDVWKTASGNEVEIASHIPGTEFVWHTTCGISYTDRGTYFLMMTSTKDLVQRISRNTEIKEALVQEPEMPKQEAFVQPISCNSTNVTISNVCKQDNDISFEDAVQMNIDNLVSLIGDRICEKVKSRDVSAVKYLTKVLEKVIVLESL